MSALVYLKEPRPLVVEAVAGPDGPRPQWVVWRGKRQHVVAIEDEWRVDEEWWRAEVSRHYFAVTLADGGRLTLFLDRAGSSDPTAEAAPATGDRPCDPGAEQRGPSGSIAAEAPGPTTPTADRAEHLAGQWYSATPHRH